MNYYEKMLEKLSSLIKTSPKEALDIINEELKVPYVPKDVLDKLLELKSSIDVDDNDGFSLNIDTIKKYLYEDEDKQCIAVEELSKLNLRDHEDIISDFLLSSGSIRAKVMLIIALKNQESSREYSVLKENKIYPFVPKYIVLPEESSYFKKSIIYLNEYYMKNPDMLQLAKELLYNDYILYLPLTRDLNDVKYITSKITQYIDKSFK